MRWNSVRFVSLRTVWEEVGQQPTGCCIETWIQPLKKVAGPQWRPHASTWKRALQCTILCQYQFNSLPISTNQGKPCWPVSSAVPVQGTVEDSLPLAVRCPSSSAVPVVETVADFEDVSERLERVWGALSASSARLAPFGRSLPPSFTFSKDASFSGFDQFLRSDEKRAHTSQLHAQTQQKPKKIKNVSKKNQKVTSLFANVYIYVHIYVTTTCIQKLIGRDLDRTFHLVHTHHTALSAWHLGPSAKCHEALSRRLGAKWHLAWHKALSVLQGTMRYVYVVGCV